MIYHARLLNIAFVTSENQPLEPFKPYDYMVKLNLAVGGEGNLSSF